jgi:hypothetical protein
VLSNPANSILEHDKPIQLNLALSSQELPESWPFSSNATLCRYFHGAKGDISEFAVNPKANIVNGVRGLACLGDSVERSSRF